MRKLIEHGLPLQSINAAAAREKSIRHGHPSTLHLWWARRPLAVARAVIFAQMVDDPAEYLPEADVEPERRRLFRIIEELVKWENTTNEKVLDAARAEIRASWRRACAENADHPRADELFDPNRLPAFHDPFAGGGALPLEAQRLGLEAYASDLNPVAVLINKAMIEIPPKFAGKAPVNPESRAARTVGAKAWPGASGLAEDVRYYGKWMRDEAEKRIGHLYPKAEITAEMVRERPDLKQHQGRKLTVIAWLWARTVRSPNPAFSDVEIPLTTSYMLSTKKGKEAWIEPVVEGREYRFRARVGPPPDPEAARLGTSLGPRQGFSCLMSGDPVPYPYIRAEGMAGRMGSRMLAIVADGGRGRVYLSPIPEHEDVAAAVRRPRPAETPSADAGAADLPEGALGFRVQEYGMRQWRDLFTDRQREALKTFSGLVGEAQERVRNDAEAPETAPDPERVRQADAQTQTISEGKVVSTDPPYYSNVGFADLSNFFYVWLRRSLKDQYPDLLGPPSVPTAEEVIASPYRHGGRAGAEAHFSSGMSRAIGRIAEAHPAFPITIYYAFKQGGEGWSTLIDALAEAGLSITGAWPVRTEMRSRLNARTANSLDSSVVLVCRRRPEDAPDVPGSQYASELRAELRRVLRMLMADDVAPVDLTQAAIGAGMIAYTRHGKVRMLGEPPLTVPEAMEATERALDEVLAEQAESLGEDARADVRELADALDEHGEEGAATVLARIGDARAQDARTLCYSLYLLADREKRSAEAGAYNRLFQGWPEITRLSESERAPAASLFA